MDAADTACFAWGQNEHGALCLPSVQDEPQPCRVLALRSQFVRAVGASQSGVVCHTPGSQEAQDGCFCDPTASGATCLLTLEECSKHSVMCPVRLTAAVRAAGVMLGW